MLIIHALATIATMRVSTWKLTAVADRGSTRQTSYDVTDAVRLCPTADDFGRKFPSSSTYSPRFTSSIFDARCVTECAVAVGADRLPIAAFRAPS